MSKPLYELYYLIVTLFDGDTLGASRWFETPNQEFGGLTPNMVLMKGHEEFLVAWLRAEIEKRSQKKTSPEHP